MGTPGQIRGSVGHSADQDLSRVQIDKEEHMERRQPDRFYREEVAGDDSCGLVPHELAPGVPLWSGPSLRAGDPSDTRRRDLDAQLLELSLDASVAPERILLCQPPHEELGLERDPPPRVDPMRSGPLPTDTLLMPSAERVRRDQGGKDLHAPAADARAGIGPSALPVRSEDDSPGGEGRSPLGEGPGAGCPWTVMSDRRAEPGGTADGRWWRRDGQVFRESGRRRSGILEQRPFDGCAWSAGGRHDTLQDHLGRTTARRITEGFRSCR